MVSSNKRKSKFDISLNEVEYLDKIGGIAFSKVTAQEATLLIVKIDSALKQKRIASESTEVDKRHNDETHSTAFNVLELYVNNASRKLSFSATAANRAPIVRALLFLREKLISGVSSDPTKVVLAPVKTLAPAEKTHSLENAVIKAYEISVGRSPADVEIDTWKSHFQNGLSFHEFLLIMDSSPEAEQSRQRMAIMPNISDGEFVQSAYELVLNRGAAAWEIEPWLRKLEEGRVSRTELLANLLEASYNFFTAQANATPHDGLSCLVMGTGTHVTAADWQHKAKSLQNASPNEPDTRYMHRFHIKREPRILVSALASMYRGGDFIEQFMDNITGQDGFDDYFELVIVDADSPENEYETIKRYLKNHKNINYIRCNYRIGIYDAWNVAAKAARGEYLTNANMDDLRRHDSFQLQAAVLENLPFVDIVYQDLYYTFDPRLSFKEISAFGLQTTLPIITPHNMIHFNSPHNAPMWRKRLHEELGYFDTHYKSAGDYDFWMRCLAAGKKFYKINDPHVIYYQNPKGLSTRPDTRGVVESMEIHKTYCRKLIPQEVVIPHEQFLRKLNPIESAWVDGDTKDRYVLAQQALRNTARFKKYPAGHGVAP